MGATRMIVLVVAAICAVGLAFIVRGIVGHRSAAPAPVAAAPAKPMAQVLVAHRDLPVGTRLASGDLAWQPWPADAINPSFITNGAGAVPTSDAASAVAKGAAAAAEAVTGGPMEANYGSIVREAILANEPITPSKLVRGGEGGYMAVVLNPGARAVAIPVSVTTGAGGFILPGDRVDVLQSHANDTTSGGHPGFWAETLLRNIRVLAIDQTSQPPKAAQSLIGAVATLEVSASDAEVLARGKAGGEMILALRSYSDAGGPSGRASANLSTGDVKIYRNGVSSDVMVTP